MINPPQLYHVELNENSIMHQAQLLCVCGYQEEQLDRDVHQGAACCLLLTVSVSLDHKST